MRIAAILIFLFGIISFDTQSTPWGITGLLLYALPLLSMTTPFRKLQTVTLCAGIALVMQATLSPIFYTIEYKIWESNFKTYTLPPNMNSVVDIRSGIPGITGRQKITTDEKGFRVTRAVNYDSDATYRIFAIGGSTTDQTFLDDHATWTHLLQEKLAKTTEMDIEVVNAGITGLRLQHHVWTLRNILDLHPDLVLFLVGINDWTLQVREAFAEYGRAAKMKNKKTTLRTKVLVFRNKLLLKNTAFGKFMCAVYDALPGRGEVIHVEYGDTYAKERGSLERRPVFSYHPEKVRPQYVQELNEISTICHENDIECLFITQPTGYQESADDEYKKCFWMTPFYEDYTLDFESMVYIADLYNEYLIDFSRQHGHFWCDAASELEPSFENFYDECHFNTQGARNMSAVVARCVDESVFSKLTKNRREN